MIKTIKIDLPKTPFRLQRLRFKVKIDDQWAELPCTSSTSIRNERNYFECDTFTAEITSENYSSNMYTGNAFLTDYANFNTIRPTYACELIITFKEPLLVLAGIWYCQSAQSVDAKMSNMRVYNENDQLIYHNDLYNLDFRTTTNTTPLSYLDTPDLAIAKTYPTNVVGTIETNDVTGLRAIAGINSLRISQMEPEGTSVRYALSFDGRASYKSYKNGSWVEITNDNIMTDGMTMDEITSDSIRQVINQQLEVANSLDYKIGLMTTKNTVSPSVWEIDTNYNKIV